MTSPTLVEAHRKVHYAEMTLVSQAVDWYRQLDPTQPVPADLRPLVSACATYELAVREEAAARGAV